MHARFEGSNYLPARRGWALLLMLAIWGGRTEGGAEEQPRLGLPEALSTRPFLRQEQPAYRNYAFQNYTHYPNHAHPYEDTPQAYYSSLGNFLITGYELYTWIEQRRPRLKFGSAILKEWDQWQPVFDNIVAARDGYGDWGYSAIVGDGLIARFTPLTLSMVNLNGARLDMSIPHVQFTVLGSRIEWPNSIGAGVSDLGGGVSVLGNTWYSDRNTLLLGSRMQAKLGALQVGLNGANLHVYQTTRSGNSLKGVVRSDTPLILGLIVRFSDDSPGDGEGGAVVQSVQLLVNGEVQPDLHPTVIRQQAGVPTQVGSTSRLTGEFRPNLYTPHYPWDYYRGRSEFPLYADYLYRAGHEAGEDVSEDTNLEGLLQNFVIESPGAMLRADGDEQLVYLFDLSREPYIESVEVEALLGNDYRVEVATMSEKVPTAPQLPKRYRSTFYQTVLRAKGNVQDLSNLRRVRFTVGENTAIFTSSADVQLSLPGLEISGEYARSAVFSRYPAHSEGELLFDRGARSADRGAAYFINASHWFGRGRVVAEYFSMNPDFRTGMNAFLPGGEFSMYIYGPLAAVRNETVYWDLVQDNEDGDRYPDARSGKLLGIPNLYGDQVFNDYDGVFPGQDEDHDGIPDTNRNYNDIPDYEELFLLYEVEPNEYVYGLDRNNNDEPDVREDDLDPDYPYDHDQRGYHLFGQVDLSRHWSLAAGRYAVEGLASGGRNRSIYGLLTYQRQGRGRLRRLFLENHFRRVHDDIPDEFLSVIELPHRDPRGTAGGFVSDAPMFVQRLHEDLLPYLDSYVNETYLEGRLNPWSTLHLVQKLRLRLNWQQGGQLPAGLSQRQRRLDYWTVVSRADYTWYWGRLSLTPQFKFLLLRLVDQDSDRLVSGEYTGRTLRSDYRVIPIFKLAYPLLSRTTLQAGLQGIGPLPYRVEDLVRERNSFERRTAFVSLTNRSRYFGYDLHSIVGLQRDNKEFDDPFQRSREFDGWSSFVRVLIGFTEYGRLF